MAARMNWSGVRQRAVMQRQGIEEARAELPDVTSPLIRRASRSHRRPPSKAELRAQAAEAVARFTGKVTRG
jgi:hypothetical protein